MRQRVLIAAALLHDPKLLIFDEPLSGLDVVSSRLFKDLLELLAAEGKAILYISHVLEVVEQVCNRVIVIAKGKILADAPPSDLTRLMSLPNLESVFAQLVQQQDTRAIAQEMVEVMQHPPWLRTSSVSSRCPSPQPLSLNAQAALGVVRRSPERSQFSLLVRHFLERFFNHETASPDGDAKTRLVQIAFATGLPGFMVALYLWPVYHPFIAWPPGHPSDAGPPAYWLQVNHHFFFVLYSFVAMGIVTVFEWDMFFPDLLDLLVLTTLPIREVARSSSRASPPSPSSSPAFSSTPISSPRSCFPSAIDPPNLPRFLAGHLLAVIRRGLFAAAFILALQGVLLSVLGERLFRKISLLLQGLSITALLLLMLLFPVFSGVVPALLQSGSPYALCCPPFWFLGIYQRLMEGPSALPIYATLAQIGMRACLLVIALAVLTYPLAYLRRVRQLD